MKTRLTLVKPDLNTDAPKIEATKPAYEIDTKAIFSGDHNLDKLDIVEEKIAPTKTPLNWLKIAAYLSIYIGWGTTYLAIRVGVQSMSPASFLGVRYFIAAAALLPYTIFALRRERWSWREVAHSSLQGIMLLCCGLLPTAYAEKTLASNITAVVIGSAPILFALFDRMINKTAIRRNVIFGMILGMLGVVALSFARPTDGALSLTSLGLVSLGMSLWSLASIVSKKLKPVQKPLGNVFIQYLASGIVMAIIAVLFENFQLSSLLTLPTPTITSLLYISLGPSLISYTSYLWLLKTEPSSRVSTYAFVNPVVAVIAGALILGEPAGAAVIAALALVIAGTWLNFR